MIKNFYISLFLPIILSIFISIFFTPIFSSYDNNLTFSIKDFSFDNFTNTSFISKSNFLWPTPGYSKITSNFGYRTAPTVGAASYHGGIDIAAPENSSIVSIADGKVIFAGWYGANGYTVIVDHLNGYQSTYGHISPIFLVSVGDIISKGDLIAKVGPKYIESKSYTIYTDKTGKFTNGATTRPTSSLSYF